MTRIEAAGKIFVALDVDKPEKAIDLVRKLSGKVRGFKIGFEFIYSMFVSMVISTKEEADETLALIRELFTLLNGEEFFDGKIGDIGPTVAGATRAICRLSPLMFNVHAFAGRPALMAARKAVDEMTVTLGLERKPLLFAVTVLTSLDENDLVNIGIKSLSDATPRRLEAVVQLAKLAQDCECDGVIDSPLEASTIREACGPNFLICTPGVRLPGANKGGQKNVATPGESLNNGASSIVVGSEATQAEDPAAVIERIIDNIVETVTTNRRKGELSQ